MGGAERRAQPRDSRSECERKNRRRLGAASLRHALRPQADKRLKSSGVCPADPPPRSDPHDAAWVLPHGSPSTSISILHLTTAQHVPTTFTHLMRGVAVGEGARDRPQSRLRSVVRVRSCSARRFTWTPSGSLRSDRTSHARGCCWQPALYVLRARLCAQTLLCARPGRFTLEPPRHESARRALPSSTRPVCAKPPRVCGARRAPCSRRRVAARLSGWRWGRGSRATSASPGPAEAAREGMSGRRRAGEERAVSSVGSAPGCRSRRRAP